jgi:hypothetical protein
MANQWFRLYSEFVSDPKVQMLSEKDQRRYIMILCLRCSNGDVTLHDDSVTFMLRISNEEWSVTKAILMEKNLIDNDNKPTAWDKRQFVSDSSAERVARHREKTKKMCNVTVTPPDSDTDTEKNLCKLPACSPQQQKKTAPKRETALKNGTLLSFNQFWNEYPKKINKQATEKLWAKLNPSPELLQVILSQLKKLKNTKNWQDNNGQFIPHPSTWVTNQRWTDEVISEVSEWQ